MKTTSILVLLAGLALVLLVAAGCSSSNTARVELKDASGQVVGDAMLVAARDVGGVEVTLNLHGLPPVSMGFTSMT